MAKTLINDASLFRELFDSLKTDSAGKGLVLIDEDLSIFFKITFR